MVVAFPYSTQVDLELPQFMVFVIVNLDCQSFWSWVQKVVLICNSSFQEAKANLDYVASSRLARPQNNPPNYPIPDANFFLSYCSVAMKRHHD